MALIALVISLFVVALGVLGIFFPIKLLAFARHFESLAGLLAVGAFRIIFGLALFLAAPTSHAPEILRTLGVIIFLAGIITPLIGVKRAHKILNWWSARGPVFTRILAGIALAIGLLLASAVVT